MYQSKLLIPTLRDAPADAEVASHKLLIRAGYIRKLASGVYTYLPLAYRVMQKIEKIISEEMVKAGAQQLLLPVVMPSELWIETGRWHYYGKELLRFKDRHDRDFCIGPTHEEAITDLVRSNVNSYRQLPMNLFQIQTKFRDEIRPRFGLMRGREFIMKDGYSFHTSQQDCLREYENMYQAYSKIFKRCGLKFKAVEAMTGNIGGSKSHEFQVLADSGEDVILSCSQCDYAANIEKAPLQDPKIVPSKDKGKSKKVHTPGKHTVEEVAGFLKVKTSDLIKTLIFKTDKGFMATLLRGDHELMEAKLKDVVGTSLLELASAEEIIETTGGPLGFSGPLGLKIPLYADFGIASLKDAVTGANEKDCHLEGVNLGDFSPEGFYDLRKASAGDLCPKCQEGSYEQHRGIEVGQVFYLGTKYSESMHAKYRDEKGNEEVMIMGTYGIGVSRTASAAVEQNYDEQGIIWPYSIAPFSFHLVSLDLENEEVYALSKKIFSELSAQGVEVLWDDRSISPGMKFKDSDLIGIPFRIVIGARGLKEGKVEIKKRSTGEVSKVILEKVTEHVLEIHHQESL